MVSAAFDDPALVAAMRAFVEAGAALEAAREDVDVLNRSEVMAVAGLNLRKCLIELGWQPPSRQRADAGS